MFLSNSKAGNPIANQLIRSLPPPRHRVKNQKSKIKNRHSSLVTQIAERVASELPEFRFLQSRGALRFARNATSPPPDRSERRSLPSFLGIAGRFGLSFSTREARPLLSRKTHGHVKERDNKGPSPFRIHCIVFIREIREIRQGKNR